MNRREYGGEISWGEPGTKQAIQNNDDSDSQKRQLKRGAQMSPAEQGAENGKPENVHVYG